MPVHDWTELGLGLRCFMNRAVGIFARYRYGSFFGELRVVLLERVWGGAELLSGSYINFRPITTAAYYNIWFVSFN